MGWLQLHSMWRMVQISTWKENKMQWTSWVMQDFRFLSALIQSRLRYGKVVPLMMVNIKNMQNQQYHFHLYLPPKSLDQLRLVLLAIMNAKFDSFLCLIGLVCSSWVTISKGTHYRAPWFPLGREHIQFVFDGNRMTSRTLGMMTCLLWCRTCSIQDNPHHPKKVP